MERKKLLHLRSNKITEDGGPHVPLPEDIERGEIGINYSTGNETLFIKNDSEKIVSFKDEIWVKNYVNKQVIQPPTEDGSNFLEIVYPIGSIYMNTTSINPFELFGIGEWIQIKDRFLLACGDTYKLGEEGGEASHVLTEDEMPVHHHHHTPSVLTASEDKLNGFTVGQATNKVYTRIASLEESADTGGGQAHNNMPPYISVYVWKRVN